MHYIVLTMLYIDVCLYIVREAVNVFMPVHLFAVKSAVLKNMAQTDQTQNTVFV